MTRLWHRSVLITYFPLLLSHFLLLHVKISSGFTVCSAKADIGILIDGSSSVTQDKFAKLLDFTQSLVKSFSVSQDRTHIAVATASRGPHMSFDFRGFNDVPSLNTAISRISYLGGPFLLGKKTFQTKFTFKQTCKKIIVIN